MCALVQTRLLLCVADSSPAMFKSFAACKLEPAASSDFGDDGLQLWRAVTVSFLSQNTLLRKKRHEGSFCKALINWVS